MIDQNGYRITHVLILKLRYQDRSYRGRAFSTDIIEASALAYLQAINRIITANGSEAAPPTGL